MNYKNNIQIPSGKTFKKRFSIVTKISLFCLAILCFLPIVALSQNNLRVNAAKRHTVVITEAINLREEVRQILGSEKNLNEHSYIEVIEALLKVSTLSSDVKDILIRVQMDFPKLQTSYSTSDLNNFKFISEEFSKKTANVETLRDLAIAIKELSENSRIKTIPGALEGLDFAMEILQDGQDTIYNSDSDIWANKSGKEKVVDMAMADAGGAIGGAIAGAVGGAGVGAGPGAFLGGVASSAGAVITDPVKDAVKDTLLEIVGDGSPDEGSEGLSEKEPDLNNNGNDNNDNGGNNNGGDDDGDNNGNGS